MRITIEIDGKQIAVASSDTPSPGGRENGDPFGAEPPPELLRAARALGAESAGAAAFTLPAGAAFRSAAGAVARLALDDADGGKAVDTVPAVASAVGPKPARRRATKQR